MLFHCYSLGHFCTFQKLLHLVLYNFTVFLKFIASNSADFWFQSGVRSGVAFLMIKTESDVTTSNQMSESAQQNIFSQRNAVTINCNDSITLKTQVKLDQNLCNPSESQIYCEVRGGRLIIKIINCLRISMTSGV